jgi:predicted NBD/HSP70 family sugar kinase
MFCEAAAMDDPLANKIIQRTASYLAAGLINVNNLLRPDIIVVGGVLIRKCRKLFDLACNIFEHEIGRNNILSMGCFGEDAVMAGAGSMVLDHYLK